LVRSDIGLSFYLDCDVRTIRHTEAVSTFVKACLGGGEAAGAEGQSRQVAIHGVRPTGSIRAPDPTALAEAAATGPEIWRTDEHGTVTITWTASGDPVVTGER
jgi:hypothetical protein